jgi:uncharacterized membrane protein YcjF (UPF0283 family)
MQKDKKNSSKAWWQPALIIFAKFSGWIALPLIASLYLGKWLDKKYNTEPWLFLTSVAVAFLISMAGLSITVIRDFKRIEKEARNQKIKKINGEHTGDSK